MEPFCLSLAELHAELKARTLTPIELLVHYEDRIARLDQVLNTIVAANPAAAAEASASTERYAKGQPKGPLDGIPCTIKDNIPALGMPCTWGSAARLGEMPEEEEPVVARLRDSGAVILGKTNCPEFSLEGYTSNATFGTTGNPWNPELTPGGSSGGAVSGVAAGLAAFAIGTDGGGSIRRPAGHTGLVGLKPSIGRIPRAHTLPAMMYDLEVVGPITRHVADCATILDALAGPVRADPRSHLPALAERSESPLRILLVEQFGDSPVAPVITNSVRSAARMIERLGHHVETGPLPLGIDSLYANWSLIGETGLAWLRRRMGEQFGRAGSQYRKIAAAGERRSAAEFLGLMNNIHDMRAAAAELFEAIDIIMTPTAAAQPWPADEVYPKEINGHPVGPRGHAIFTGWVNAIGHPAIALPAAPDDNGVPIGYQLIGDFGDEARLLALATHIEAADPWAHRWPPIALV